LPVANFFLDNQDIQFLFDHIDLEEIAATQEGRLPNGDAELRCPRSAADAVDNYRRILGVVGQIAATQSPQAPSRSTAKATRSTTTARSRYHPLVQRTCDRLAQADMMGFTLPRKYGGLNCPNLLYTMATEIVSRADAS
jgi:alkylation response protein AidB-like acyl-CoA dehydrogenase